jgi:predicted O-linked N-acetylglucosamine transferase (SPINDLY family)
VCDEVIQALVLPLPVAVLRRLAAAHGADAARWAQSLALPEVPPDPRGPRRLHIGYLSHGFGYNVVGNVLQGLFRWHQRPAVYVSAFSLNHDEGSPQRRAIRASVDTYLDVSQYGDLEAARAIRSQGVDVLVTLDGWTKGSRNRILALQPAAVQVNAIGFSFTMGSPFVQYNLVGTVFPPRRRSADRRDADRITTPPQWAASDFSEKLLVLPDSYFGNTLREFHPLSGLASSNVSVRAARSHASSNLTFQTPAA